MTSPSIEGKPQERTVAAKAQILIVEDNERNARLIVAILSSAGYETTVAVDGCDGCRLAAELQPTAIITDLQMPRMDGLTMTRSLKGDQATKHIPVIAVSAHALTEHKEAAMAAGCIGFLAKPIRMQELLWEVANAVSC